MVAQECNLVTGNFIHTLGDAHIYVNHVSGLKLQLERKPLALPQIKIAKKKFSEIKFEDIQLINYRHQGFIKFPIAV